MGEPLRYTLTFTAPASHYVEVSASVPTGGQPQLELYLPVWTPGSYKVRDYARHLEAVVAESTGGNPLPIEKTAKHRWRVTTWGASRITVRYRVYGHELSVRTNFVGAGFALIQGAATFLTLADDSEARPHEVDVALPPGWSDVLTSLAVSPQAGPHGFVAPDYDTLVDCPIYAGKPTVRRFEVDGVVYTLADEGAAGRWDAARAAADVERIVRAETAFWGTVPYPRYLFLNLLTEGRGGLEHRDGCVLMASRYATAQRASYLEWLGLVAHELFHAWNVKRLRPLELGPFDYEREVHTRSLWVAEGITSYYDALLVRRAGLSSESEYLAALSKVIRRLQTTPGRQVRCLEEASYDAWLKLYQPDDNTDNSAVSYYNKGAVVAFLLDARIRRATGGAATLDDALRLAYGRHAGDRGFTSDELEGILCEVANDDLRPWLDYALRTTGELDYTEALEWYGLRFVAESTEADEASEGEEPEGGWLGAKVELRSGRTLVLEVPRETPAHAAGLAAGDEIVALDEHRVGPLGLEPLLAAFRPSQSVRLLVARRLLLRPLDLELGEPPADTWNLVPDPKAGAESTARRADWLGG